MERSTINLKEATKRALRRFIPAHKRFERAGKSFLTGGEKEVHELPRLVTPGTVAIDVGSLTGDYTYALQKLVGPSGLVICVEPQPEYAKLLRLAAQRLKLPIEVHECALSSRAGEAELNIPDIHGKRMVGFANLDHEAGSNRKVRVALRRLDDITSSIQRPISFLKVDVEGHELEVFKGAVETLKTHRPNLLVEIEQRHSRVPIQETFAFILAQGYSGFFLDSARRRVPLAEFDPAKHQIMASRERTDVPSHADYVANFLFTPVAAGS